jgi:hypothetical protein
MSCSRRTPLRELGLAQLRRRQVGVTVRYTTVEIVILRLNMDKPITSRSSITLTTHRSPRPVSVSYQGTARLLIIP